MARKNMTTSIGTDLKKKLKTCDWLGTPI